MSMVIGGICVGVGVVSAGVGVGLHYLGQKLAENIFDSCVRLICGRSKCVEQMYENEKLQQAGTFLCANALPAALTGLSLFNGNSAGTATKVGLIFGSCLRTADGEAFSKNQTKWTLLTPLASLVLMQLGVPAPAVCLAANLVTHLQAAYRVNDRVGSFVRSHSSPLA